LITFDYLIFIIIFGNGEKIDANGKFISQTIEEETTTFEENKRTNPV